MLSTETKLSGGFWDFIGGFDLNKVGFGVVALFILLLGGTVS